MRQRPLARERHEAGGEHQESLAAAAPAGNQSQHGSDGLLPDRAGAAREVRRGALGALRRGPRRRQEVVCSAAGAGGDLPRPPPPQRTRLASTRARKSRTTRLHAPGWARVAEWLGGGGAASFGPRVFPWLPLICRMRGAAAAPI